MSSAVPANGLAPERGDAIEEWAATVFGLTLVDETYYDGETYTGLRVQIKGAKRKIRNGRRNGEQQWINGRFVLWSEDHRKLLEDEEAMYLFVVYDTDEAGDIVPEDARWASPALVDTLVPEEWYEIDNCRVSKGDQYRLSWREVFR